MSDELSLRDLINMTTFYNIIKEKKIPKWHKEACYKIWELNQDELRIGKIFTSENIKRIIDEIVVNYREEIVKAYNSNTDDTNPMNAETR